MWLKWSEICKLIFFFREEEGKEGRGLGVRDLESFNKALFGRQVVGQSY